MLKIHCLVQKKSKKNHQTWEIKTIVILIGFSYRVSQIKTATF